MDGFNSGFEISFSLVAVKGFTRLSCDPNPKTFGLGVSPLVAAVSLSRGNPLGVEVIRTLLEHRADPNKVNRQKILAIFSGRFWCLVGNVNPTWLHDSFSQLFFCGIWVGLLRQATSIFALRGLQTDWHRLHQFGCYWQGQGVECECCGRGRIIAGFCPGKSSPRLVRESYKVSMR